MFVVMRLYSDIQVENGMPVQLDKRFGIVGILPVFRTREEAEDFCSGCDDVFALREVMRIRFDDEVMERDLDE